MIAAGAIPVGIALIGNTKVTPPPATATALDPSVATITDVEAPAMAEPIPPPAANRSTHAALPSGQVWQCVVNGQKTFSDSPCGDNASIRQLSEVNGMDPTPAMPVPGYPPPDAGYYPYSAPYAAPYAAEQDPPDTNDDYVYGQRAVILAQPRLNHGPRPHHPERRSVHARD